MLYIIGRISDKKIVEKIEIDSEVSIPKYMEAIAKNYGGVAADYSVLALAKDSPEAEKIRAGAEWEAVWVGSAISAVDFTVYESKGFICFESDKPEILADGGDSCMVTIKITDPSGADIAVDITDVYIPVQSPLCSVVKKVDIVSGSIKFDFRTSQAGTWIFPGGGTKMIDNYRVKNQIIIEALLA